MNSRRRCLIRICASESKPKRHRFGISSSPTPSRRLGSLQMTKFQTIDFYRGKRPTTYSLLPFRFTALDEERYRSEEHTSELQSPCNLVCRLLLEKKKNATIEPRDCSHS